LNSIAKIAVGVIIGGALGFGYCKAVGYATGACPLTSNPWISTLYGMLIGGLIAGSFH